MALEKLTFLIKKHDMKMEESLLYKNLVFLEKYRPPYNVKEVFQFMLGYQLAASEVWISDFNKFLERKLLKLYTNDEFDRLPRNCGEVIYENQKSDEEGLNLFFETLQEFHHFVNETETSNRV